MRLYMTLQPMLGESHSITGALGTLRILLDHTAQVRL